MRSALFALSLACVVASVQPGAQPSIAVGVWYAGPGAQPPATATADLEAIRRDLATLRHAGFNAITTWVAWRDAEPRRGSYVLSGVERLVAAATEAKLETSIVALIDPPPSWAAGAAGAAAQFVDYLSRRLGVLPGVIGVSSQGDARAPVRVAVPPQAALNGRMGMWSALARGARTIAFDGGAAPLGPAVLSLGETAGIISRNPALFDPLRPRTSGVVRIDNGEGVDVRLLESADAMLIVGVNAGLARRTATITFAPDIPEAIWQNLETGTSVNFVMSPNGPVLEHTFAPRDALVLSIRKGRR